MMKMSDSILNDYPIDLLGNKITPGDICILSVRGWGMELGVFVKETPKKLSFRIPCWWCLDKEEYSVSAITKNKQRQKVVVLKEPWFHLDADKILILLNLKDSLINKGVLKEELQNEHNKSNDKEAEEKDEACKV